MLELLILAAAANMEPVETTSPAEVTITVTARDLTGLDGNKHLMRRISIAAEEICGSYAGVEYYQWDGLDRCRQEVFDSARQQLAALPANRQIALARR